MEETLQTFIGEEQVKFAPLVVSGKDVEFDVGNTQAVPAAYDRPVTSLVQDMCMFVIERIDQSTIPFKGQWPIWIKGRSDLSNGSMLFELHKKSLDAYSRAPKDRILVTVRHIKVGRLRKALYGLGMRIQRFKLVSLTRVPLWLRQRISA